MTADEPGKDPRAGAQQPEGRTVLRLAEVVEALGYRFDRRNGSHRVYIHPAVPKVLNVQAAKGGKAKEYQVKEMLRAVESYGLRLGEDPS